MVKKRRIAGAAAGCAVAVATLLGTPSAKADEVCISCEPVPTDPAFIKIGATENAFWKIPDDAFLKVGEQFPFLKWTPQPE